MGKRTFKYSLKVGGEVFADGPGSICYEAAWGCVPLRRFPLVPGERLGDYCGIVRGVECGLSRGPLFAHLTSRCPRMDIEGRGISLLR
mgnify:CR=1 FL=1